MTVNLWQKLCYLSHQTVRCGVSGGRSQTGRVTCWEGSYKHWSQIITTHCIVPGRPVPHCLDASLQWVLAVPSVPCCVNITNRKPIKGPVGWFQTPVMFSWTVAEILYKYSHYVMYIKSADSRTLHVIVHKWTLNVVLVWAKRWTLASKSWFL